MTMFNEREQGFEAKFAHDEELRFRIGARRDKLFAHWAGERLGVPASEIEAMTASVVALRDGPGHDARLLAHMATIFTAHGAQPDESALAEALADCTRTARAQLQVPPEV